MSYETVSKKVFRNEAGLTIQIGEWPDISMPADLSSQEEDVAIFPSGEMVPLADYSIMRMTSYPSVTNQIDNITKALKHLSANGIDIGPDGNAQVEDCFKIKLEFPKT